MKNKSLKIRISERRLGRLQNYAAHADQTMTQVIEELIDTLPNIKNGDSSSTLCSVNPQD